MMKLILKLSAFFAILVFTSMSASGQQPIKNYESSWKTVNRFIGEGLPESALAEVKKIHQLARAEKQDAQVIKSLITMVGLQDQLSDEEESISIAETEKAIAEIQNGSWKGAIPKEVTIAILNSYLAGMYREYFQENRWELYERTNTTGFNKTDIATWTVDDFHKRISELFLASILPSQLLKETALQNFDALIIKGNMRHLRPTLYDLLAHRAIDYFDNIERNITRPVYAFQIHQTEAFAPAAAFIRARFDTKDELSLEHKALLIYQDILAFHINDKDPSAFIDADLARIAFVNQRSVHPAKESLYFQALKNITEKYNNLPAASQAFYLLAQHYYNKGSDYHPFRDTTYRDYKILAREILVKIIEQKDSSEGKINAHNLLYNIDNKDLRFQVEKVNVPGSAFRMFVEFTNIDKLHLRIIKMNDKLRDELARADHAAYWKRILNEPAIRSWTQQLPVNNDFQQHRTEIKVDALPPGEYMIAASNDNEFSGEKVVSGARAFFVSNISYVNNGNDYFVLNRETGQPLAKAAIQVWKREYDYKTSKYNNRKAASYITDQNGFFRITEENTNEYRNSSSLLEITHGQDRLFLDDQIYNPYYYSRDIQSKDQTSIFFFTDRSLYRPGQEVYFKGIVLSRAAGEKKSTVNSGYSTTVILKNTNGEEVDSIQVTTNEYGSFNGKFRLPATGLNGSFSIATKKHGGYSSFMVEDYKRPKFFVEYEKQKGVYKVNDSITVTGIAKAYAGNSIDDAKVSYRVVRQPRYLYPWRISRMWLPPVQEMEITNGIVSTGSDGKFTITFLAIPDLTIDPKHDPVFDYKIYADVTDINGETRSGEKQISVAYKSLVLATDVPDLMPSDSLRKIKVKTQNMNGEFVPAKLKISISELKNEQRLIRKRFWERPDQFVMSKEEYIKHFPYDEYAGETDPGNWETGKLVYTSTDSSAKDGILNLKNIKFGPGHYLLEIEATAANGETTHDKKFVELTDENKKTLSSAAYLRSEPRNIMAQPGESAVIDAGTSANDVFLIQSISRTTDDNEKVNTTHSYTRLDNEKKEFTFPVTTADFGGFGVSYVFVKHNRVYTYQVPILVPWTNKHLNVQFLTYRDKTMPGSQEKWSMKITGNRNEKVAAEMMASMYDASLDQFNFHSWTTPRVWPVFSALIPWNGSANFTAVQSNLRIREIVNFRPLRKIYDQLLESHSNQHNRLYTYSEMDSSMPVEYSVANGLQGRVPGVELRMAKQAPAPVEVQIRGNSSVVGSTSLIVVDGVITSAEMYGKISPEDILSINSLKGTEATAIYGSRAAEGVIVITTKKGKANNQPEVAVRKNFNETAFFFPELRTDSTGAIEFSFTIPEALTKWKFMALAHTKDAAFGSALKEIVTQKDLMVQPNSPRFLREGDKMELNTKIVNLTDKEITGQAELQLFDATTNQPVDGWFHNMMPNQYFTVAAGESEIVKFPVEVPYQFNRALVWKIIARAGQHSDGEENTLPVLSNRTLVTETMTLPMKGDGTRSFTFDKLLNSNQSSTLQHHALTFEYTSNPAWYAVQALPYLMEYPYDCAEQTWNRYYANSLASHIINASPRIKMIFDQWKTRDTAALLSNLRKNQELKSILLEETPWVLAAKTEDEQKKNLALLFDFVKMNEQLEASFAKLKKMQSPNGGFVWFTGGPDDRYMTQYIVTGIGHLLKLNAASEPQKDNLNEILDEAIEYLDRKIMNDYNVLVKNKAVLSQQQISYHQVQYLYMRSFFPSYKISDEIKPAYNYYRGQAQKFWTKQSRYMQGMTALALFRSGDNTTAAQILKSLKENAIKNEEMGMYWKQEHRGWFWYEAPIETQSLLIEAFQEIGKDQKAVDDMKTWLLKNKQTNNWESTKATAEAVYALLMQGADWLNNEPVVTIKTGSATVSSHSVPKEAGTGYFKQTISGDKVKPEMGNITVTVASESKTTSATWGGVYWQYFEDLDKITRSSTPLSISKKLFNETVSDRGPVLTPVNDGDVLKVGDKIKVRVELRVDRDMEYVHMKDMRASALEPVNVLSGYKYQGSLGYYESTRDASTNFFFSYLRKGTYVFEYTLFVTHTGNFSNGITTIQCMYAPEFTSHSEGIRITVE